MDVVSNIIVFYFTSVKTAEGLSREETKNFAPPLGDFGGGLGPGRGRGCGPKALGPGAGRGRRAVRVIG